MVPFTLRLDEVNASLASVAGGKGASLGELIRAGVPVPPGFVVTAAAFQAFLARADPHRRVDAIVENIDRHHVDVAAACREILDLLRDAPMPTEVAEAIHKANAALNTPRVSVRSSATCEDSGETAWAGQLDTYLDVAPANVLQRIHDCWLSIFSVHALTYGAAHGYGSERFSVAVVVQKMVASDVSGVGFSVHPVTQEPNLLLIEACLGLGEAIVSGKIVPDQFIVERGSLKVVEDCVGQQSEGLYLEAGSTVWRKLGEQGKMHKLTGTQVVEYAGILARVHDHYGFPVDTEWALEEGKFHLLQARPITTLAEEYEQPLIDLSREWHQLVRRPMSLIESSIWAHWIDSEHSQGTLGFSVDRAMSIQDDVGMAIHFHPQAYIDAGMAYIKDLYRNNRQRVLKLLRQCQQVHDDSMARIERGAADFGGLDEAADFFAHVAQHTTVFPAWVMIAYDEEHFDDPELRALAERLRADTQYPHIERRIIDPLVKKAAREIGFSSPEEAPMVTTWKELHHGTLDRDLLEWRLEQVRARRRFLFKTIDGVDEVKFLSQTGYLLMRLAKQRQIPPATNPDVLTGQAAWPGVYQGRARLILKPDTIGETFIDGEVLVSIQSSPALMPFLRRCGAIVTDDGGIACHAAIICRELRKPTLIGTRLATSTIRTGDLVEVDTFRQTVRIVERGS